jgi:sec-independent protein translocase protein TatA
MAGLGGPEIILIMVVVLLMFGGKKIPEMMRGLGKGMKEFKDAKDGLNEEPEPKQVQTIKES